MSDHRFARSLSDNFNSNREEKTYYVLGLENDHICASFRIKMESFENNSINQFLLTSFFNQKALLGNVNEIVINMIG